MNKDWLKRFKAPHVRNFWWMLLLTVFVLTILRIIFFFLHKNAFPSVGFKEWGVGFVFDWITVCIYFLPFALLHFLPIFQRNNRIYRVWSMAYFFMVNIVLLLLNLIDLEYFKFTSKRSTTDLFAITSAGSDISQLLGTFLIEFWWMWVLLILFLFSLRWAYKKVTRKEEPLKKTDILPHFVLMLINVLVVISIGRGGWSLRPIGTIEAAQYTQASNTALVLNTGFTMLKSYGKEGVEPLKYYSTAKATTIFNPIRSTKPANILPEKTSVVIIMLESFGNEWMAFNNKELKTSYTPFLDSLAEESMNFQNGYANGKKSIEAVPSIISSLPSLMDNPYISSPYGNNAMESLPDILKKAGYSSGFYHGATNGSMRFDGYAAQAGFDNYFGRTEYDNDEHFDKTWGISDEYFNPWAAKKMSELKAPFFATLFTLSSHHPYFIPENRRKQTTYGPEPICGSINYGDFALRKFFKEAKKQPWYDKTLFVICADHTPSTSSPIYSQRSKMYSIPILFYHPSGKIAKGNKMEIFQQLDIMPTILDLLNIKTNYYAFGNSYYQEGPREGITYLEGIYSYFSAPSMMEFTAGKTKNMYNLDGGFYWTKENMANDPKQINKMEKRLKAIIQRYNNDLIKNQTKAK
ncbi:MAG: sulfatase-like hydrolase/transferase [Flavobacteriales bacterium]|jgi:phosphoglycerol transferase MdoB-like AlkP superfamily enzyme